MHKSEPLILVSAVAISRFLFRSHDLYDLDSVNFALAMQRFDPSVHQPHPPGYFLYVCMGRLLNLIFHDANLALVVLSIAASCGTVLLIYKMALDWFGPREAKFAAILLLFSPLIWFHGTVALTYIVEAFFSALVGYLCWHIDRGNLSLIASAGAILGISAGVRPSSLLFLGPLFFYSFRKAETKRKFIGLGALALTLAAWFLPMISASGGFGAYFGALISLWRIVPSKDTVFNSSPATSIARAFTIVLIYFLCFGAASVVPLVALRRGLAADPRKKLFTIVWVAPALCFFILIFLKFVNSGYLLLLTAPACIWLGFWASEWYGNSAWRGSWKLLLIGACSAINVLIFLASPFYCSYRSVRQFEKELGEIRTALPQIGSAKDTVVVGFDSHFLGYRHAGYYLPNYLTLQYHEVKLVGGTRVFAMQNRDTRLLAELPVAAYSKFVFFPLPSGDVSYQKYLESVEKLLPEQTLRTVRVGKVEFVTGTIGDLSLLFPGETLATGPGVYPLLHP